ncbi:hypothetical protein GGF39_002854, partial [Coemansia sp. RSA 1721]
IAAAQVGASNSTFSKRAISFSEVKAIRGALLFKNGRQTTCEVGLISMKAGFIAASCFDYNGGNNINTSTKYEIYIQDGSSTPIVSTLSPSDITLHPNYNPSTYENNIAVIQFNKATTDGYIGYVITDRYLTEQSAYVRRTINPSTGKWNDPQMTQMIKNQDDCSKFSGLYASNMYELACSPYGASSMYQSSCTVPHGTVYTRGTGTPGLIGVMSYMVVEGDSTCKGGTRFYVYYSKLWNYDRFATSVLGYPVNVLFQESPTTEPGTQLYSNKSPLSVDMSGKTVFSGDFYAIQGANQSSDDGKDDAPAINTPVATTANNANTDDTKETDNPQDTENTKQTKDSGNNDNDEGDKKSTADSNEEGSKNSTVVNSTDDSNSTDGSAENTQRDGGKDDDNDNDNDEGGAGDKSRELNSLDDGFEYAEDEGAGNSPEASESAGGGAKEASDAESQQANAKDNSDGLGRTQIIVIAIVVPVVALLVGFIAFLVFRYLRGKKEEKAWDPIAEENYHRNAVLDLGGAGMDMVPPPYVRAPSSQDNGLNLPRSSEDSTYKDVKF